MTIFRKMGSNSKTVFRRLGRGDFLGAALLAEFLEEFFLAERIGAVQQTEQQVFRIVGGLAAAIVFIVGRGQRSWCDEQLG